MGNSKKSHTRGRGKAQRRRQATDEEDEENPFRLFKSLIVGRFIFFFRFIFVLKASEIRYSLLPVTGERSSVSVLLFYLEFFSLVAVVLLLPLASLMHEIVARLWNRMVAMEMMVMVVMLGMVVMGTVTYIS